MSIENEINRTKSQIANYKEKIRGLEEHGENLALLSLGLSIGDRIIVEGGHVRRAFEAEVIGVESWSQAPRPKAMKIKKDGTVGEQSAGYISKWRKK